MNIARENPSLLYKCDKCGKEGIGGKNPTIFCFDRIPKKYDYHLCRSCYETFWKLHTEFCEKFLDLKNE